MTVVTSISYEEEKEEKEEEEEEVKEIEKEEEKEEEDKEWQMREGSMQGQCRPRWGKGGTRGTGRSTYLA